jgi:ferredoxin
MKATRASAMESPVTERSAPASSLHVVVDLNRCQSYAQCCFLAPSVFQLHGEEALWYDPSPDAGQWEHVQRAAAACPVQAITVEGESAMTRRHRTHPGHTEHRGQREEPHAAQRA